MDAVEEKESHEDFLSQKDDSQNLSPTENQDTSSDENIFNPPKESENERDVESYEFNHSDHPVSDAKMSMPELNHLNALANLDPSSKFYDSAAFRDMRLAANVPVEDETSKVFMCHLCDFKTAYANSLMNHQAVHSDIRPWACAMCEYAAKRKQDLKKHLHTVHGMMVESPMLKPILPSSAGGLPKFPPINEGLKDQFVEGLNLKRSADHEFPFFPQPSSGHQAFPAKRIKEELPSSDVMSPSLSHERKLPSMSEPEDSPDDNLPVSFPPSTSKSNETSGNRESPLFPDIMPHMPPGRENGELGLPFGPAMQWHMKKRERLLDPAMREWAQFPKPRDCMPFPPLPLREKTTLDSPSIKMSSVPRLRDDSFSHSFSEDDSAADDMQSRSTCNETQKPNETDRSISSSCTVSHARWTQTQSGFMCEHCDILFFQRAMYLMHKGLHSPNNPWCCTVCGQSFSEKYSFTSHFINQH